MNSIRICLSVFGTSSEICDAIRSHDADLYEIRLDLSHEVDGSAVRNSTGKPLLFTAHGSPEMLKRYQSYADYLDVEQQSPLMPSWIQSLHAKREDPVSLYHQHQGDHYTKIVLETENYATIQSLLALNHQYHPRGICFAAGEAGKFSRILSLFYGAPWVYACLPGRATGSGQISFDELIDTYRIRRFRAPLDEFPSVFGIVGDPVAHSRSPEIQNRFFVDAGLNWIYLPFHCKNLNDLFQHAPQFGVRGFSITHPFKEAVIPMLKEKTSEVETLRSCNAVCFKDGSWRGTNTDLAGVEALIRKHSISISDTRIVILGAGGAARTIAAVVRPHVRSLTFLNRSLDKAKAAAEEWNASAGLLQDLPVTEYDVLFQATPSGWVNGECPIDPAWLSGGTTVVDAIYRSTKTVILQKAESIGCKAVSGQTWFEAQAHAQFLWWRHLLM